MTPRRQPQLLQRSPRLDLHQGRRRGCARARLVAQRTEVADHAEEAVVLGLQGTDLTTPTNR